MGFTYLAQRNLDMKAFANILGDALMVAIACCGLIAGSAQAQPAACHALAASPTDPDRKGPGVPYGKIEGARASSVCQLAVKQAPKDGQLWFQYGRALEKANRVPEAYVAYQTGSELGNAGADNNLGELYRDGKGVTRDLYMAEIYFHNASVSGLDEATQNLNALERAKPPSSKQIPIQFQGKFSLAGQTCSQTQANSQHFGGEFMGLEVTADSINQFMESQCMVMGVSLTNAKEANAVLKCGHNTPIVHLAKVNLTIKALRFETPAGTSGGVSVRC
jgi:hypothetical protein